MRGAHGFLQKAKPSRHNQVVRSGRRQRGYPMINKFYKINFEVIIGDKTISKEGFETSLHETKQQCLDEAHQYCMNLCNKITKLTGNATTYNWTDVKEVE